MGKFLSDVQIIQALKKNWESRNRAITFICGNVSFRNRIFRYVREHGGSIADAEEIYQDGVFYLVKSILADTYRTESSLEDYFFGICKYLWYRKYRQSRKHVTTEFSELMVVTDENRPDILLIEKEKRNAINDLLQKLGEPCRTVLTLWCSGYAHKEIAEKMGYSENYSRQRVFRCKRQLEALLDQHPEFLDSLK